MRAVLSLLLASACGPAAVADVTASANPTTPAGMPAGMATGSPTLTTAGGGFVTVIEVAGPGAYDSNGFCEVADIGPAVLISGQWSAGLGAYYLDEPDGRWEQRGPVVGYLALECRAAATGYRLVTVEL